MYANKTNYALQTCSSMNLAYVLFIHSAEPTLLTSPPQHFPSPFFSNVSGVTFSTYFYAVLSSESPSVVFRVWLRMPAINSFVFRAKWDFSRSLTPYRTKIMGIDMSAMPMKPNIDTENLSSNARNTEYPMKDLLPQAVPRLSRSGRLRRAKQRQQLSEQLCSKPMHWKRK